MVWEMSFEEFQESHHGGHLGYRNGTILAILNLCVTVIPPPSFSSIRLTVRDEMWIEEFQDGRHGSHLGYRNGTILAITKTRLYSLTALNTTFIQ